ncbi:MAG: hypothetical protein R3C14_55010 [Caldilineaceae bacterium]
MDNNQPNRTRPRVTPDLTRRLLATVVQTAAIVFGIGAMPFIGQTEGAEEPSSLFWLLSLAIGLLTMGIGIYVARPPRAAGDRVDRSVSHIAGLLVQWAQRVGVWLGKAAAAIMRQLVRLRPLAQRLAATLQRTWQALRARLPRRRQSTGPAPVAPTTATPTAQPAAPELRAGTVQPEAHAGGMQVEAHAGGVQVEAQSGTTAPVAPRSVTPATQLRQRTSVAAWFTMLQEWLYLLTPTVTIGVFVILAALVGMIFQRNGLAKAGALGAYFGLPALILWLLVQGTAFYTQLIIRPKRLPQLMGMAAGLVQLISTLFLWIYLGLALALTPVSGLFWLATGLALAGVAFDVVRILSEQARPRPLPNRMVTSP